MDQTPRKPAHRPLGLDPAIVGTACCVASALCYTAANVCLRKLAELEADEMWVTCIKETVAVLVMGPWLLVKVLRRSSVLPSLGLLLVLVLTGLAVQLGGNVSMQWAYGVVGIAITIAVIFGAMLLGSALMGYVFLGEKVSTRSAAAIAVLVGAIALLSLGATFAGDDTTATRPLAPAHGPLQPAIAGPIAASGGNPLRLIPGVAAGLLAGITFALLSTVVRFCARRRVPISTIVFVVTLVGVVSLGSLSIWRLGAQSLLDTPVQQLRWMLAAGVCNLTAFLAITKGLHLTTVVHANMLNASQVAMGALAGVFIFTESLEYYSILGICLTIVGIILFGRPGRQDQELPVSPLAAGQGDHHAREKIEAVPGR